MSNPIHGQNQGDDIRPEANGDPAKDAASLDTFLAAALAHRFINRDQVTWIKGHAQSNNVSPSDAALQLQVLAASEAEAIKHLANPQELFPGFELTKLMGCGAGGMVFAARQLTLERDVALKTISPGVQISNSVSRMQREALSIARLQHPNIVSVYDSAFSNGKFCIVMELVQGGSLFHRIKQHGPLSEQATWHIARQVASALHHANERGIIHRDIKPGNILLGTPPAGIDLPAGVPFVKVADFGLALERESTATQLTATGTGLGTPSYVAPEQIDDSHVDLRADIYALGATVFHMLTGAEPYADTSPLKVIAKKASGDDSWRDQLPSDLSSGSRQLLLDLTESNADRRIGGYEELIDRIDEVLLFATDHAGAPTAFDFEIHDGNTRNVTRSLTEVQSNHARDSSFFARWRVAALCLCLAPLLTYVGTRWVGGHSRVPTAQPHLVASNWQPHGLPTPLFNGTSVPRFRQTGFWQPTVAGDGSRVLTGRAASTLSLPVAVEGSGSARLRLGVSLGPDDKISMEVKSEGNLMKLLSLDSSNAHVPERGTNFPLTQPDSDGDVVFQRIEVLRIDQALAVIVNGKQLMEVFSDQSEITIRCETGQPQFADIDLGRMVVRNP